MSHQWNLDQTENGLAGGKSRATSSDRSLCSFVWEGAGPTGRGMFVFCSSILAAGCTTDVIAHMHWQEDKPFLSPSETTGGSKHVTGFTG